MESNIHNYVEKKKVFLGGTVNSKWRDELISQLKINYFNPVVPTWTEEEYQNELMQREICDYLLYAITPKTIGFYSIAELVDDSNKRPEKTLYTYLEFDEGLYFDTFKIASLNTIGKMIVKNGARWFSSLGDALKCLNGEEYQAIRLGWDTWNEVCGFVPEEVFDRGVYLEDTTIKELPEGKTSNTIGLRVRLSDNKEDYILVAQGDYLAKSSKVDFTVFSKDYFEATYRRLEKTIN